MTAVHDFMSSLRALCFLPSVKKQCIRFSFCDIQNNQGLSVGYQPHLWLQMITPTLNLIIQDITNPHPVIMCRKYVPKIWVQHTQGGMHFQDETKMF